jgi:hypothetical protein
MSAVRSRVFTVHISCLGTAAKLRPHRRLVIAPTMRPSYVLRGDANGFIRSSHPPRDRGPLRPRSDPLEPDWRYESHMGDPIVIRPAVEGDCDFITGLVTSLLEFGSPAWNDKQALAPGFREALAGLPVLRIRDQPC